MYTRFFFVVVMFVSPELLAQSSDTGLTTRAEQIQQQRNHKAAKARTNKPSKIEKQFVRMASLIRRAPLRFDIQMPPGAGLALGSGLEWNSSSKSKITEPNGRVRRMTWNDIENFVQRTPQRPDGSFRIIASLAVEGESIGPFRYEGTRSDDPNDITPHENRRDLRGLYVFSAWLNNTDIKATNTLDTIVQESGTRFIRHYLIDFGSALGSDGDRPKDARFGHEFMLPTPTEMLKRIFQLGLVAEQWEEVRYPNLPGIGNFSSEDFNPDDWKSNYPNPAFLSRLPDDDFWAAKQVMAFTDDDIRAIVETAKFSDARSADYMIETLAERRNKIGRTFFSKILPLDHFRVVNRNLLFEDLAVQYGFHPPRKYDVRWFRFSNTDRTDEPIGGAESTQLPFETLQAPSGAYISAAISAVSSHLKPITVFFRKEGNGFKVVGIDRGW